MNWNEPKSNEWVAGWQAAAEMAQYLADRWTDMRESENLSEDYLNGAAGVAWHLKNQIEMCIAEQAAQARDAEHPGIYEVR